MRTRDFLIIVVGILLFTGIFGFFYNLDDTREKQCMQQSYESCIAKDRADCLSVAHEVCGVRRR